MRAECGRNEADIQQEIPNRLAALDKFLSVALLTLELVPVPTEEDMTETQIRDVNDRPILRAAIEAKADVLLTGDKDFLESGVKNPANYDTGSVL